MRVYLKYDLRSPDFGVPTEDLYAACLEQAAWADTHGFSGIRFAEHHGSLDGYVPSPITLASAVASRTERLQLRFAVLVLPLHDPVRIAEDLAVLDNISRGRVELVVAAGYVQSEFDTFQRDRDNRIALLEAGVEVLRAAWSGEPSEVAGRSFTVRPRPYQGRQIPIYLGGSSPLAARLAAKIADGFDPAPRKFLQHYVDECERLGKPVGWYRGRYHEFRLLHIANDPDAAWDRISAHALHENNSYAEWMAPVGTQVGYASASSVEELRASGTYRIVTPEECLEVVRELGEDGEMTLHPLMGGMDPDLAWESLTLFESTVMPALRNEGLLSTADCRESRSRPRRLTP